MEDFDMRTISKYINGAAFIAVALIYASFAVRAAVTPNSIVTAQTPNRGVVQFLQGTDSAGTYKTLYTAGVNGSKCFGMYESNNDGSATHLVTVQIVNGGVKYGGMAITTASNDGFANATPAKALMSSTNWPGLPVDGNGNPTIYLVSGDTLQATFATSLTSSDLINIYVSCVDF
jgi:hypothetical protein